MFSSNLTLKATMLAEKVKEKEDNRLAGRYVKIRALLDEAEKAINSSNISRSLKNKLIAKHVKARKALDTGLNVEEVIEMMTLIVSMINQEIRQDKSAIDTTTMEMRRHLDTFYKYDFDKFLEREQMPSRQYPSETSFRVSRPRSQTRERSNMSPLAWRRSPSEGNMRTRTSSPNSSESERKSPSSPSKLMTFRQSIEEGGRGKPKISEEVEEDVSEEKLVLSDNEEIETFKRDVTSAGIESLEVDEDDAAVEQDLEVKHSLETLTQTLSILQEVPNMVLNSSQRDYLVPTMRATKRLLMTPRGCAALGGPISSLKSAIDAGILGVPKEPQFTQSLVEISMVISSFEGV